MKEPWARPAVSLLVRENWPHKALFDKAIKASYESGHVAQWQRAAKMQTWRQAFDSAAAFECPYEFFMALLEESEAEKLESNELELVHFMKILKLYLVLIGLGLMAEIGEIIKSLR